MFDEVTMVNGVFTQGRNQGNDKVTMFRVLYTEDGTTWKTVNEQDTGVEQVNYVIINVAANVFFTEKIFLNLYKIKSEKYFLLKNMNTIHRLTQHIMRVSLKPFT